MKKRNRRMNLFYIPAVILLLMFIAYPFAQAIRVSFYSEDGYIIYEPNVESSSKTKLGGLLDVSFYDATSECADGCNLLLLGSNIGRSLQIQVLNGQCFERL